MLKRLTRWILRLFAYTAGGALALAVVAILFGGFTTTGAGIVTNWLSTLLSNPDQRITIDGAGPLLTGALRVEHVAIADTEGVYAEIDNLALDWTPLDLLSGTFRAQRLAADRVRLDRTPVTTVEKTQSSGGFSLPIAINVKKLELPSVEIGTELARREIRLSLTGSGKASGDTITAHIEALRPASPETSARADLVYAPSKNRLQIAANIVEPTGGLLAGLLKLPGTPAIDLTVEGDGPLSDWQGKVAAALDGRPTLAIHATHQQSADGTRRILIEGGGRFDAMLPPGLRPPFADETTIDIDASLAPGGAIQIDRGSLSTGALSLSASGRYDPSGENDLSAELTGLKGPVDFNYPNGSDNIALAIREASLSLRGSADAALFEISAKLDKVKAAQGEFDGLAIEAKSKAFDLANQTGRIETMVSVAGMQFANAELNRLLQAPMTLKAPIVLATTAVGLEAATIESASIGGTVVGQYALADKRLTGRFELFGIPGILPDAIAAKLRDTIRVSGNLNYNLPQDIKLNNLKITTNLGEAAGNIELDAEKKLTADLAGRIADIGALMDNTKGVSDFSLSANGPLDALAARLSLRSEAATVAGRKLEGFTVDVEGTADKAAPKGTLRMAGRIDGQQVQGTADLVAENGRSAIPALNITVGSNRLDGAIAFSPAFLPSGNLTFDFPDIGLLAAFAGQTASGDLKGTLALQENNGKLSAQVVAAGEGIQRDTLAIAKPDIRLSISDLAAFAVEGTVAATEVKSGANRVEAPKLAFTRQGASTAFDLNARYDAAPLVVAGSVTQNAGGLDIALDKASAAPTGIALKLARPAALRLSEGTVTIGTATISAGSGTVDIKGSAGHELDLAITLDRLPASLAAKAAPNLSPEGVISGKVTVKGTAAAPALTYNLNWADAGLAQTRSAGVGSFSISANGEFRDQNLSLDTRVTGQQGLAFAGGGTLGLAGSRPINMKFTGDLPFAALSGVLSSQGLILEGSANADVTITGNAGAPEINGTARTSGAKLIDVRRNLALEQLAATVNLRGDRAEITELSGKLASGGRISGSGTIDIRSPGLPADIAVTLDKAVYVDGTMVASTADGKLALKGPLLNNPVLSGTIALSRTAITIPEKLPASLSQLNIQHRNAPAYVRNQMAKVTKTEQHGSSSTVALDLTISSPSQIFVRGRGIDAELGGTIRVTGNAVNPNVSGGFELRRGRMSILTKRLEFTEGTITFGGGLIPILDMKATTTSGTTTITITIAGFANDPSVSFSSSPALPQDEILAQLIFGQSMSRLSALQIAQLADAASQLAGGRSGSLFESLRSTLGVDDLDISTDETGQTNVSAGKYLNNRTYIELQQSGSGQSKAVINLDVGRGVKLKGEAGAEGAGGGIFYEKEY